MLTCPREYSQASPLAQGRAGPWTGDWGLGTVDSGQETGDWCIVYSVYVYPYSLEGGIKFVLGITGAQFFQSELKPVRRVSVVANLKRFQHKGL